VNNIVVTNVL